MAGMVESGYYRTPSNGRKGNKPSLLTYHATKGFVDQETVISSIKDVLSHEFIDCGYHIMCSYLKRDGNLDKP